MLVIEQILYNWKTEKRFWRYDFEKFCSYYKYDYDVLIKYFQKAKTTQI